MSRLRLASAVLCVLLAVPARAQEQVEVFAAIFGVRTSLVNVDATLRGFGGILASTPLTHVPTGFLSNAATVAGGRYLAWITDSVNHPGQDLFLFDRRTRTVSTATDALPAPPPGTFLSSFYIVGTDTHRPRLFVQEYRTSQGGRRCISGPSTSVAALLSSSRRPPPVHLRSPTRPRRTRLSSTSGRLVSRRCRS